MKCDVIIPVFNAPDWVKLCVRSVISQTPEDYLNQIILVDDASNAFTRGLLKIWRRDPRKSSWSEMKRMKDLSRV